MCVCECKGTRLRPSIQDDDSVKLADDLSQMRVFLSKLYTLWKITQDEVITTCLYDKAELNLKD